MENENKNLRASVNTLKDNVEKANGEKTQITGLYFIIKEKTILYDTVNDLFIIEKLQRYQDPAKPTPKPSKPTYTKEIIRILILIVVFLAIGYFLA